MLCLFSDLFGLSRVLFQFLVKVLCFLEELKESAFALLSLFSLDLGVG